MAAAAALGAGLLGAASLARWRHERLIEKRLDRCAPMIRKHAEANGLPVELVRRIIRAESGADPRAVSPRNARGLMQITPPAERQVLSHVDRPNGDLFDPDYNIFIGTTYLRQLVDRFGGEAYLAVGGYHAGPTRIAKLREAHPDLPARQLIEQYAPPATSRYCRTILRGWAETLPAGHRP